MAGQKLTLQQKLLQKLSPQQIQMIKLLELPAMQLEQRIKRELEENPVLEIDSKKEENDNDQDSQDTSDSVDADISIDEYINDEPSYKYKSSNYSKDDKKEEIPFSIGSTFHEFLIEQLGLLDLDDQEMMIAEYIIGNIDEDGYLRREIEAMVDDLAFTMNLEVSDEEMLHLLNVVQDLDPPGIGARDLQECLLLQLKKKEHKTVIIENAINLISNQFEEFTKKHYDKIMARLNIDEDDLRDAIDEIVKLNPKPGGSYSNPLNRADQTIIPDFVLDMNEGQMTAHLTKGNVPDLRISGHYANMLKAYSENRKDQSKDQKEAVMFVKQKLDSAKWFIDAIKQRHQTLLLTMNAIIDYQKEFFVDGDEAKLKPMILKDIAQRTGLDISTISRVSNSKYIQTHFGIYSLKYFFSESMQDESGEEVSTRKIKKILQDVIDAENKRKPVTDDALADLLKEKGFPIARRTVAKYREQLNIPVARLRKEL
ncbi:MAG TPA: RNA polymerase factor sigma-54 [Prolixibacteraceae bacterium]|nr:RNA polymerase factor sigma-54 [Prolixibacteraceae bacterium]HPS11815.1 RNA polymerase factor sigma-54 [Prolixibacteraceae bacterium]